MTTLLSYPAELPCPQTSTVTPAERRALSDAQRPREARALQRDRLDYERLTWPPMNDTQCAALLAWWRVKLIYGGAWFGATWPLPRGFVEAVRKLREQPHWEYVAGGYWRISALCEVRGRGVLPQDLSDPYFAMVVLLLHADSTPFIDHSSYHRPVSAYGGADVDQVTLRFGSGSADLRVPDSYLTVPISADFGFDGPWTIECFVKVTSTLGFQVVWSYGVHDGSPQSRHLSWSQITGKFSYQPPIGSRMDSLGSHPLNTWLYVAVTRDATPNPNTVTTLWVDGVPQATIVGEVSTGLSNGFQVSDLDGGGISALTGWVDDLRVTNGVDRDVTVIPTRAFPNY